MSLRALARFLLVFALVCGVLGCSDHLVGTRDVVSTYTLAPGVTTTEELVDRIRERLSGGEVTADVEPHGRTVRIRADADIADDVEHLLLWRGGVALATVDAAAMFVPQSFDGLRPEGDTTSVVHGWIGRRDVVARAVRESPPAPGHLPLVQPTGDGYARTRMVTWPPVAEIGTSGVRADGPRLVVPLSAEDERALDRMAALNPTLEIVRDRTDLATLPLSVLRHDHTLIIPLGSSIVAYTEAADLARLLATPPLPPMTRIDRTPAAADWSLASANLLLPLVMSMAWLFFVRRFDRAQPEPMWLVFATFALGALAVVPAGLIEWGWDSLSPYTNATFLTYGRMPRAFPIALAGFVLTVGLTEEAVKLLATWSLALQRREFDEPVDGIVYGAAAALGFAAVENIRYLAVGRVAGALVVSRAFMSVPAHLFFGTIWGYAFGRQLVEPKRQVWPLFALAVTMHGLFDTCLSIDGGVGWACAVNGVVASLFVVHLQRALRHGPVQAGAVGARGAQELFRMGSRPVFAAFVVLVYLFCAVVFALGLVWEGAQAAGRIGLALGVASTVALALLGWAARGLAATLPLDVVVDDHGVTFAGAAIRYADVVRIERRRLRGPRRQEQMIIVGDARQLILGPASRDTIDALSHALAMRLSSVALRS
jgi:RsiW-degrading membrane proteinase PrsW (M82 family)